MAIEANELIPPAYVYKPVSFGTSIRNVGQAQMEAQKYKSEQAKKKDQDNKRALNVDIYATTQEKFNKNLSEMRSKIVNQYSELAAQGHNLSDPSDDAYTLFQNDLNAYKTAAEQFKGAAAELKGLEIALRQSDPDIAEHITTKINNAKDAEELNDYISEAYNAYNIITKNPNVLSVINRQVSAAGLDAIIQNIKADKKGAKTIEYLKEINDDKIPQILSLIKADPEYKKEEAIFNYKKENQLPMDQFADMNGNTYDTYEDYMKSKISDAIAAKDSAVQQYREKSTFNFNTRVDLGAGGTATPSNVVIPAPTVATGMAVINGSNPTWNSGTGKIDIPTGVYDRSSAWGWSGNKQNMVGFNSTTGILSVTPQQLAKTNPTNGIKAQWDLYTAAADKSFGGRYQDYILPDGNESENSYITVVKYDQFGNLWGLLGNSNNYVLLYSVVPGLSAGDNGSHLLRQLGEDPNKKITDFFKLQ